MRAAEEVSVIFEVMLVSCWKVAEGVSGCSSDAKSSLSRLLSCTGLRLRIVFVL